MKLRIHAFSGALALLTICAFWTATVLTELFGGASAIAIAKNAILAGMLLLVPSMAIAGGTGFSLGGRWRSPAVDRKKRRMKIVAANGLVVLVPSAIFLAGRADTGQFDASFFVVQALELIAGAVNIALLSLNMRDGFALRRPSSRASAAAGKAAG